MLEFDEKVLNVTRHTDMTTATGIVPFDVDAHKFIACHVEYEHHGIFEKFKEMGGMFNSNIFDSKTFYKETELDGTPFVMPEARHGSRFIVAFGNKAGLKKIISEDARLGKSITPLVDFEVNSTIMVLPSELVLLDKFLRNVWDFYLDIFWVGHRCIKVEVFEVDGAEACPFLR